MRDDAQPAALSYETGNGLGEELTVEDHDQARVCRDQEAGELQCNVPGRQDVLPQQETSGLVIFQMVAAQYPTQARQAEGSKGNGIERREAGVSVYVAGHRLGRRRFLDPILRPCEFHQLRQGTALKARSQSWVSLVAEPMDAGLRSAGVC